MTRSDGVRRQRQRARMDNTAYEGQPGSGWTLLNERVVMTKTQARQQRLEIDRPCWLEATGHQGGVQVKRSPLVDIAHEWCEPATKWIEKHGLVLASEEAVEDDGWMFGGYWSALYVVPDAANQSGEEQIAL